MKTLKITFLLLAVLLLTVSGQSSDTITKDNAPAYKTNSIDIDLIVHEKSKIKVPGQEIQG